MKNFRTIIEPTPSNNKISYQTPALFLGSCFTENIGKKMKELKFPALVNPFGVLYNPVSVRNSLEILIDKKKFVEPDLHFFNDQWLSFNHDTEFSNENQQMCLDNINFMIDVAVKHLKKTQYLIVTFGTAWVYRFLKTNKIVSNCHKIPAKEFERFKLSVEDIFVEWASLINKLNQANPNLKIIFTVSPVRHWKDGAVENQRSKSTLILAIHQLCQKFDNAEYFPSYEIMMDDLRDYRFYADDMLHPSKVAIDYIWSHFGDTYFRKDTMDIVKEVEKVQQASGHRVLNPNSLSHKKFIENQRRIIDNLEKKYSFLDFSAEKEKFS